MKTFLQIAILFIAANILTYMLIQAWDRECEIQEAKSQQYIKFITEQQK